MLLYMCNLYRTINIVLYYDFLYFIRRRIGVGLNSTYITFLYFIDAEEWPDYRGFHKVKKKNT